VRADRTQIRPTKPRADPAQSEVAADVEFNPQPLVKLMKLRTIGIAVLTASTLPCLAWAAPPKDPGPDTPIESALDAPEETTEAGDEQLSARATASTTTTSASWAGTDAEARRRLDRPWIKRWAPERRMGEFGIFGGAFFPSPNHELFRPDPALPDQGFRPLARVAPDLGVRVGYYPLSFLGLEFEGAVMPAWVPSVEDTAFVYSVRGHLLLQLPFWSVTPFVLVGGGGLGVASDPGVLGNDIDPMVHFGGGLKFYLSRYVALRIEVRDIISHQRGVIEYLESHNPEVLLGLSITPGRKRDKAPVRVEQVVVREQVVLQPPPPEPEPLPPSDRDGDGIPDDVDACPDVPENFDGHLDEDGCPEELPEEVKAFTGTIRDITFETNSDQLRVTSIPILERAAAVLQEYPNIRMQITGHTDDRGNRDHNLDLSRRRAEAVKTYLVEHGIDSSRIITSGLGPDQPIDDNKTKTGRANNRRIEFEVIQPEQPTRAPTL
jgi:outer membrane protein OmpA-like peptidoglycan-associated protein